MDGTSLFMIRKLSFRDACNGYSSNTILPGGEKVFFKCTRPIQTGTVLKISGKGLENNETDSRGDLFILFNVEVESGLQFKPEHGQCPAIPVTDSEQKKTKEIMEKRGISV